MPPSLLVFDDFNNKTFVNKMSQSWEQVGMPTTSDFPGQGKVAISCLKIFGFVDH